MTPQQSEKRSHSKLDGRALLSADFVHKLDALAILSRRLVSGPVGGTRRAQRTGSSLEFSDFRTYAPGDDYRRIDWNVYARLDRLFLRLFDAEESLSLTLILDCSASMGFGMPTKLALCCRIAAAMAYVALGSSDRVSVAASHDHLDAYLSAVSGRSAVWKVWDFLERLDARGDTDLNRSLDQVARRVGRNGLSVVFSDLLVTGGYRDGLMRLLASGAELCVVQVLAPEEIDPDEAGDWEFVDSEGGPTVSVSLSAAVRDEYRRRLARLTDEVQSFCARHGAQFLQLSSAVSVEDVVLRLLRRAQILE